MNPSDVCASCITPITRKRYEPKWKSYLEFCNTHSYDPLNATDDEILEYFCTLINKGLRSSTIGTYRAAISTTLLESDGRDIRDSVKIQRFFKGAQRREAKESESNGTPLKPNSKKHLPYDLYISIVKNAFEEKTTEGIRDRAMLILSWNLCARFDEVDKLVFDQLDWDQDRLLITFKVTKTRILPKLVSLLIFHKIHLLGLFPSLSAINIDPSRFVNLPCSTGIEYLPGTASEFSSNNSTDNVIIEMHDLKSELRSEMGGLKCEMKA